MACESPGHRPGPFDGTHGPEHAEGFPGKVISFHIVPLDPAYPAHGGTGLAGHVPVRKVSGPLFFVSTASKQGVP